MAERAGDDGEVPAVLERLWRPHVESFDYFLGPGLERVVEALPVVEAAGLARGRSVRFWLDSVRVGLPTRDGLDGAAAAAARPDRRLFPRECREAGVGYRAPLLGTLYWSVDGGEEQRKDFRLGQFPIMVKSACCHLRTLDKRQLVRRKEEAHETGGYFIVNGLEKLFRLLIVQRRHYIMGMKRGAYSKRGPTFTEFATAIRCVRPDETGGTMRVHYLTTGSASLALVIRRQEYFLPLALVLKALVETSDAEIFNRLVAGTGDGAGSAGRAFVTERAEALLNEGAMLGMRTRSECLAYIGRHFRQLLDVNPRVTDAQAGELFLAEHVLVHLSRGEDKAALLFAMLGKLYALVSGACSPDNPDSAMHQEILLPGHLLMMFVKERLDDWLQRLKELMAKDEKGEEDDATTVANPAFVGKCIAKACTLVDVGRKTDYLLSTGNLVSRSGLGLSQTSGFTIVAEKLNYLRYLSHFRSVHRGSYFAELRTTTVRKLLPESWGFMCPVHTPDGSPCGLLNHLAHACDVHVEVPEDPEEAHRALVSELLSLGVMPAADGTALPQLPTHVPVILDGAVVGVIHEGGTAQVAARLREMKVDQACEAVPATLEVGVVPASEGGPYPGMFLFTNAARMVRPVVHLASGKLEYIGSFEQVFMDIKCPDGGPGGSFGLPATHSETDPGAMLSAVASLTPWSDFNQSPRNMYQCQMGKQTMGFPLYTYPHRNDGKLYRIQTPQRPIARTKGQAKFHIDEFPLGTNAVVAVLSHTGYDMEDAMILNKSAVERGFAHASLLKSETIDLDEGRMGKPGIPKSFAPPPPPRGDKPGRKGDGSSHNAAIEADGLPRVGAVVKTGESYACTVDKVTGKPHMHKLKDPDPASVEQVVVVGTGDHKQVTKVTVKKRYNRNPIIGDKFSSRHGQKGVLSFLWPDVDMPYCPRTGIRPDALINPHAFPSRMTIGMLVESMASKLGALDGEFVNATPFQRCEEGDDDAVENPVEYFGERLAQHGYHRFGTEQMVCGLTGEEFTVDIFIGLVYYQRLRHMVSDKFQVRSVGPINALTRQPVKGRKVGGGIRFGEMERDAMLGHGAAYLLHDRLHLCSDRHVMDVCSKCGSLLSTQRLAMGANAVAGAGGAQDPRAGRTVCRVCDSTRNVERVAVPYVFKYLLSELAAMNIRVSLDIKDA